VNELFLEKIIGVCGPEHVLRSREALEYYSRCTIPWSKRCGAVIFPANRDQLSMILKLANEFQVPVWSFSRGHNWGFGTVLALQEGALIIILERLDTIHEVNELLCYAVIEPGVSQKRLNDHLKEIGSRLWIDCTDSTPDGSVIGNALDKGTGYTPYGDHFGTLCGLEVVLANGSVISQNSRTQYTYKWGTGPFVDGLFVQSNLGIVTKAGVWLMPKPERFKMFVLTLCDPDMLASAIDGLRELGLREIVHHCHIFNEFAALARTLEHSDLIPNGRKCLNESEIQDLARKHGLSSWTVVGGISGTREHCRAHEAEIRKLLKPLGSIDFIDDGARQLLRLVNTERGKPGAKGSVFRGLWSLFVRTRLSQEMLDALLDLYPLLKGEPNESVLPLAYFKNREKQPSENLDPVRDQCGFIWFCPLLPADGEEIRDFVIAVKRICSQHEHEAGIILIQRNPRTLLFLVPLFFDRGDSEETDRAHTLYQRLCEFIEAKGYQHGRLCTSQMEQLLKSNPGYRNFLQRIKNAVDPNQILAPGRYGVWGDESGDQK
jgi:4-cresol dehydrogenase (hydroxylating)